MLFLPKQYQECFKVTSLLSFIQISQRSVQEQFYLRKQEIEKKWYQSSHLELYSHMKNIWILTVAKFQQFIGQSKSFDNIFYRFLSLLKLSQTIRLWNGFLNQEPLVQLGKFRDGHLKSIRMHTQYVIAKELLTSMLMR